MKNALLLAMNTLKITFRKKSSLIAYLILPVLSILISFALYGNADSGNVRVGIVDEDRGLLSKDIINSISSKDKFQTTMVESGKSKEMVASGKVDFVMVIPRGFEESIFKKAPEKIGMISIKGAEVTAWISYYINVHTKNLLDMADVSNGNKEVFSKLYNNYKKNGIKLESKKLEDQRTNREVLVTSLGFLLIFILYTATNTTEFILKEKRSRTYFRICSSPVSGFQYVLGNIIANLAILFVQVTVVLLAATKLMGIQTSVPIYQFFIVLMCFGFVAIAIGMVIVGFSKDSLQASTLTNIIINPTCMLGGCFWPLSIMPDFMKRIANFVPQKWVIEAVRKLQTGKGFFDITIDIAVILGFAAALFMIAIYKFNRNESIKNVV